MKDKWRNYFNSKICPSWQKTFYIPCSVVMKTRSEMQIDICRLLEKKCSSFLICFSDVISVFYYIYLINASFVYIVRKLDVQAH